MIELEYTTGMEKAPILSLGKMRLIHLATFLAVVVIGVLGVGGLTNLPARLAFISLCLAFALVYAVAIRRKDFVRWAHGYFAGQTILFIGLLTLRSPSGAFTFLLFILAIQVTTVFSGRIAAGWVGLFYLLASLTDFLMNDPENAIGSALFNIAAFLLAGMIGHSTRQAELTSRFNQELVEVLQTVQRQLQELAVAEERNRLAREIHDGLGHYLTATTMQIQGARALLENTDAATQAPTALNALSKAETLLQEALADVRRSVGALRAAPPENPPLPAAIGDLVAECRAITGLEAQFDLLGLPRTLNSQIELTLYRVAQEGLTNVRKHAQAGRVEVVLAYDNHPDCRVIVLTTFDDDELVFEGLRAGAVGYLLKAVSAPRLLEAIRTVARGESILEPSLTSKVVAEFARLANQASRLAALESPLSEREIEVLRLVSKGATNREIAATLFIAEGTVRNHLTNILGKLGVSDRTQAAVKAKELGLV